MAVAVGEGVCCFLLHQRDEGNEEDDDKHNEMQQ